MATTGTGHVPTPAAGGPAGSGGPTGTGGSAGAGAPVARDGGPAVRDGGPAVRNGAAAGYRPHRTLPFRTEFRRQASRRRTQLALAFMVLLPLIVLLAFQFDSGNNGGGDQRDRFASLVDVATSGGLNFTLFTLLVSSGFLLVVVVALFCGDTVASEASWGSLRYLLAAPVPRARLLGSKLLVALTLSAISLVLLTATALAAGTARYGWHPLRSTVASDIAPVPALGRIGLIMAYIAVTLLVVGGLAFLLSVSTDAPLGAVGGAVLLNILSSILDQITALGSLRNILPTHYAQAWLGVLSTPVQTGDMVSGTINALCYAALFFGWAWWHFLRKDVTS